MKFMKDKVFDCKNNKLHEFKNVELKMIKIKVFQCWKIFKW